MTLEGIHCYKAAPQSEWYLKDDSGSIIEPKRLDFSIPEAREWWIEVPVQSIESIDGVLADGAGYEIIKGVSATRLQQIYQDKLETLK